MSLTRIVAFRAVVAATLFFVCDQARAGYVSLPSDLGTLTQAGNYTSVNNYTFTFSGYSATTNGGVKIPASSINVNAVNTTGPGFQLTGPLAAAPNSQNDIAFAYTISTTGLPISAISLNANGFTTGGGIAQVVENIYSDSSLTKLLGVLSTITGSTVLNLKAPVSSLYVTEDITYSNFAPGDNASFSIINQTFTVPEPSSMALVGLGLAGVGVYSRRRSRGVVAP